MYEICNNFFMNLLCGNLLINGSKVNFLFTIDSSVYQSCILN